eukprot:790644_1
MSLFDFVKKCHQYIQNKMLSIKEWHKFCKIAIKQITDLVDWLHNKMNVCHLDLSLENFVIDNVMVMENTETKMIAFLPDFQIRIIDFGLAEVFHKKKGNKIDFQCNKYVGKRQYKAPEVYKQKHIFDARAADCWSLSVVFFIMWFGCPPWYKPSINDITFNLIMYERELEEILTKWNKMELVTCNIFNFLNLMFQEEKYRLTIREIKRHPFLL